MKTDEKTLRFIHARLIRVHKENPNTDYMQGLQKAIDNASNHPSALIEKGYIQCESEDAEQAFEKWWVSDENDLLLKTADYDATKTVWMDALRTMAGYNQRKEPNLFCWNCEAPTKNGNRYCSIHCEEHKS